jgi:hypothetical protein
MDAHHCINCDGDHPSYSRSCPKWKEEKEIQRIRVTTGLSFIEARRLVQCKAPTPGLFYAGATKNTSATKKIETKSSSVQTDLTWVSNAPYPAKVENPSKKGKVNPFSIPPQKQTTTASQTSNISSSGPLLPGGSVSDKPIKINRTASNRNQKGSNDPILQYNRFGALEPDDEEESMVTEVIPPTPVNKPAKKKNNSNNK